MTTALYLKIVPLKAARGGEGCTDFFFFFSIFCHKKTHWNWVRCLLSLICSVFPTDPYFIIFYLLWNFKRYRMFSATILNGALTFATLWFNSADDKLMIVFLFFSKKIGFDISCKLSPQETICKKYQNLLSGKNKKYIFNVVCWKFYPERLVLRVKKHHITEKNRYMMIDLRKNEHLSKWVICVAFDESPQLVITLKVEGIVV